VDQVNKKWAKYSLVALIVGSVLLYFSIMGASGIGLALTGDTFQENFDSYPGTNQWATGGGSGYTWGTPLINPAGQLEMSTPSSNGRCSAVSKSLPNWPTDYTFETRMKFDTIGAGGLGQMGVQFYQNSYWIPLAWWPDHIACGTDSYTRSADANWHVWTVVVSGSLGTFDLWDGTTKLTTMHTVTAGSLTPKISLDAFSGTSTSTLVHIDYFYVDSGLHPPGGGGSSYSLTVNAKTLTNTLIGGMSCTVTGSTGTTTQTISTSGNGWGPFTASSCTAVIDSLYSAGGTTYTFDHWLDSNGASHSSNSYSGVLNAGSNTWTAFYSASSPPPNYYTVIVLVKDSNGNNMNGVQVTFNGAQQNTVNGGTSFINIQAGSYNLQVPTSANSLNFQKWNDDATAGASRTVSITATVTYTAVYSGSAPPNNPWDIVGMIRNLFNSAMLRQIELIIGSVTVIAGSGVMAAAFFYKKKGPSASPSYVYA
jgi:hypothetical protein